MARRSPVRLTTPRSTHSTPVALSTSTTAAEARAQPSPDWTSTALIGSDRAPVIQVKIQPPPVRPTTLSRGRLLDRLATAVTSRVTLIVAEAGYGKTTLLADFSTRVPARCLWYRLDENDRDTVTWTNYLIAAVKEIDPLFGHSTLRLLAQMGPGGPPERAAVASFLGELAKVGEAPTILVLDDYHLADEAEDARAIAQLLIHDAPPWLHFVIASRRRPSLELGRLAAMGELAEIATQDLRFTRIETESLFSNAYGTALDEDVLVELDTRSRGWAASLQLFHGSIRGRPNSQVRALIKSLSGANAPIYDFLAQEVLRNLPADIDEFLMRASLVEVIVPRYLGALYSDRRGLAPSDTQIRQWIDEADRLGLLTRSSELSEARQLHPLLRDFLRRALEARRGPEFIRQMHRDLATACVDREPLLASRHFIEAGDEKSAMSALARSVMLTMGSGQWGFASALIERLKNVEADPAVAAIRARRLIDEGDLAEAARVLSTLELAGASPEVRAVCRYAKLSLGWRTGDRSLLFATLDEIMSDAETPRVLSDIAQVFLDASPLSTVQLSYPDLVRRLLEMARRQQKSGHDYYAAVSLHNAAIAQAVAGDHAQAIALAHSALEAFDSMSYRASERFSTHAVLAVSWAELGDWARAEEHMAAGRADGGEHADVPAEFAYLCARVGERARAVQLIADAEALERQGLSDLEAAHVGSVVRAFLELRSDPANAIKLIASQPRERPLDVGNTLEYDLVVCLASLLAGDVNQALSVSSAALDKARLQVARGAEARFRLVHAIASDDWQAARSAVADAGSGGELGLLELADVLAERLQFFVPIPAELHTSIARWPKRWLPVLRRQLERGDTPASRTAALLLDEHGTLEDVARLRAFAKTYNRRGRINAQLGRSLARRVAPRLEIRDLGRVRLNVDTRTVELSAMRRKPASLLMYLVTRPNHTATREQVLDELWPDNDPASASNSLNQTLYFLRREIDPWYEDDVSTEYVPLEGDLVWLDPDLVRVESASFLSKLRAFVPVGEPALYLELLDQYRGHFAPEFEYEEWAMAWRGRVEVAFLEFAHHAVATLAERGAYLEARDAAQRALEVDPDARDIERLLVTLYWRLGARSAARAQYKQYARHEREDGIEPASFESIREETALG